VPLTQGSRASLLAFLTAFLTLFTQVLVHRMVSAKLFSNYAFLVISLTMLGFAFSGVILSRWSALFHSRRVEVISVCGSLFALTMLVTCFAFYRAPTWPQWALSRPEFVVGFFRSIPLAMLYALPFSLCGLILGILLSSPELPVRRIYFYDLVGSALGAMVVIPAINAWGVEKAMLAACGTMVVGVFLLAPPGRPSSRGLAGAAVAVTTACVLFPGATFRMRYSPQSTLAAAQQPGSGYALEYTAWDPVARIDVLRIPPLDPDAMSFPALIGDDRAFLARFQRMLTQNNRAPTFAVFYDGRIESLKGVERTIYAAAYEATSVVGPRVAVIGVGGGFDVLTALNYGASAITGIEVNRATVEILTRSYRDYFRPWADDPRIRIVHDEGRSFLASHPQDFDVIQISGVDSFSPTPAAAHVFSENYIYTAEAFDLYLSRLSKDGILNVMRNEYDPPREMLRVLTTAIGALRRAGVSRPADHVLMVSAANRGFTAMLMKKTPFVEEERRRVASWCGRSRFFGLSAGQAGEGPSPNLYQAFLALGSARAEERFVASYLFDIAPADDDRPFFFRQSFWWHLFPEQSLVWEAIPVMEYSLLMLFLAVCVACLVFIYLPLRWLGPAPERWVSLRYGSFFASIGLGYMAVEIALLQKFGLFLGHPNYALSVVLAALLLATGVGSLVSGALLRLFGQIRFVSYALAILILIEYVGLLPRLARMMGLAFGLKVALVFALVAPLGLCLGVFLPSALERIKTTSPSYAPWAWGVNGIFSVLGPLLAVGVSMTWGIGALLLLSIPIYLLASFVLPGTTAAAIRETPSEPSAVGSGAP
jgi:spermidine synthase